ncbi:hybrid sensor histidine kinase/response regulator transcription factor [Saccharicrinis fermentans]|uniref:hybrid sensor histidine kinase/response regulator transcription factor n=1 Tax=Saccharicrinis fermentans TaxID=982 RepID=UPI00126900B0|nr:two-component regulator propeller domain-containing protein [Saccharicrinis fermentans]
MKYYLLLIFLSISFLASAQLVKFQKLSMGDGLSDSRVRCIGQDRYGFMWLGTSHGLNIYDGTQFRHFFSDAEDSASIPGNDITKMVFQEDSIWLGTRLGLGLMNVVSKECKRIDLGTNFDVRTLFLEKDKSILWVGTSTGLIKYDIRSGKIQEFNTHNSNISHNTVRSLYKDTSGNLWVGTFDKLNKLSLNSTVFEVVDLKQDYNPKIKNDLVLSILPDDTTNDSILWIGTQTGLVHFNRFKREMRFFRDDNSKLVNSVSKTLLKASEHKLWIGTDFGLGEMNKDFDIQLHFHDPFNASSLANNTVWDVFEDDSGTMWFATNNGVSILSRNNNRFQFYPLVFNQANNVIGYEVRDMIEDSECNLWLATQSGVVKFNSEKQLKEIFNAEQALSKKLILNETRSVLEDREGKIWIATNGGVAVWNPLTKTLSHYTADFEAGSGLRSNYITGFFELDDQTILVNSYRGLHRKVEHNGLTGFEFIRNIPNVSAFHDQFLWSFKGSKLLKTNTKSFETFEEVDFRMNDKLFLKSILFSENDIVWLGVKNGLIKYDLGSKKYEFYEIKSNKTFSLINLLADDDGSIWASSSSALLKFSPKTKLFDIYPNGKEVPISRFVEDCCLKRSNGELIFGGQDGFIKFSPADVTKSNYRAPVKFTNLYISNKSISVGEKVKGKILLKKDISFTEDLELDYASGSFLIAFSSLHFGDRNGIRYAYRLEGEDYDWNYINSNVGQASYANLHAGKYKLRVKGTNNDGVWNPEEAVMNIRIHPPLLASPFFIVIYFILLVFIILAIFYYYSRQSEMRNQLKIIRLENQHAEDIDRSRQQFFTNISHELATPLSLIIGSIEKLGKASELKQKSKKYVQIIENNVRRLLWLNNQLFDFRKLENKSLSLKISEFEVVEFSNKVFGLFVDKAEQKNIAYTFISDMDHLLVKMDFRKLETILFNLLSNAFKFTPSGGTITLTIGSDDLESGNSMFISVKDSGVGLSEEDQQRIFERFYQSDDAKKMERGSGIGLSLVKEYAKMHEGKVVVNSQLGQGSEFKVFLSLQLDYDRSEPFSTGQDNSEPLLKPQTDVKIHDTIANESTGYPTILLVEDDKEIAEFIQFSLKDNYKFSVASNGKKAFQVIAETMPDLVISDVSMPEMDGIEFTKRFKSNSKTAHIPLILLTGKSEKEVQIAGFKNGADAYILKPFEIDLLEIRIENLLKDRVRFSQHMKIDRIAKPTEKSIVSADEKLLKQIVACIENFMTDSELNVEKICKETGVSHSTLYRKVKNLTGQNVNELIRTVRVRRAAQLLATKKFSVAEVMYETGFSNHSYFSKCFRKLYKVSPKEYIDHI